MYRDRDRDRDMDRDTDRDRDSFMDSGVINQCSESINAHQLFLQFWFKVRHNGPPARKFWIEATVARAACI